MAKNFESDLPVLLFSVAFETIFTVMQVSLATKTLWLLQVLNSLFLVLITFIFCKILRSTMNKRTIAKEAFRSMFSVRNIIWVCSLLLATFGTSKLCSLMLGNSTSDNTQAVFDSAVKSPLFMFVASCLCAPVIEEVIFRDTLFWILFKDRYNASHVQKIIFIVTSTIIFTMIHQPTNLIQVIAYCSGALFLSLGYAYGYGLKTTIPIHMTNNFVALTLMFVL